MAYTDFSIDSVADDLGINLTTGDLFPGLRRLLEPPWLLDALERGKREFPVSEKARSEFIVAPILLACKEHSPGPFSIQSGARLDVDPARGLVGECDFILSATPPLPGLRGPLVALIRMKWPDREDGISQCIAQMAGARQFNERSGDTVGEIFGCVTYGEIWHFLRLADDRAEFGYRSYSLGSPGSILAAFVSIFERHAAASKLPK
jgi:hypothetical protein